MRVRERGGPVLDEAVADGVLGEVSARGYALVKGAVPERERRGLLAEARAADGRFLSLPPKVNGVEQRADQLSVRLGNPRHPRLNQLDESLRRALAEDPLGTGADRFVPNEARYMRYTGAAAGLGAHRDGKFYALLVCVLSVAGTAPFTVCGEGVEPSSTFPVEPGDLLLLRAPGLAGIADGRPRHAVGAPLAGERVSLTLRMVRGVTRRVGAAAVPPPA